MNQFNQINNLFKKDLRYQPPRQKLRIIFISAAVLGLGLIILMNNLDDLRLSFFSNQKTERRFTTDIKKPAIKNILQILPFSSSFQNKTNEIDKINILAIGRPGQGRPGEDLTDTIILAHLNFQKEKIVLISLPRDLLVKIPSLTNQNELNVRNSAKINYLYNLGGAAMLKQKITEITGLPIDYYILIDLQALKEIIDLVDGLNISVPYDIYDPQFPGPNYSYQTFKLKAGWRYLDGKTALKYVRTRHFGQGDFDRMNRQQQVLLALKQKVLSLNPLWNFPDYLKIFQSLKEHIQTDLSPIKIISFWQMTQEIKQDKIISFAVDKEKTNLLSGGQIMLGDQKASVVWPKKGLEDYSEIKKIIQEIIN